MCLGLDLAFVVVTVMVEMDEDDVRVSLGSLHRFGTSLGRPG